MRSTLSLPLPHNAELSHCYGRESALCMHGFWTSQSALSCTLWGSAPNVQSILPTGQHGEVCLPEIFVGQAADGLQVRYDTDNKCFFFKYLSNIILMYGDTGMHGQFYCKGDLTF